MMVLPLDGAIYEDEHRGRRAEEVSYERRGEHENHERGTRH